MSPRLLFILILAIAGTVLYSRKDKFKAMSARNQFLTLLLCYYAIPVISDIFPILRSTWNTFEFQNFINSDSIFIILLFRILSILTLLLMLIGKGYGTGRQYRIGLSVMLTGEIMAIILKIIENISDSLVIQMYKLGSLIYTANSLMTIVGTILFILSSIVDRRMKIFVISEIFLPSILISALMVALQNKSVNFSIMLSVGALLIDIGLFIIAFILAKNSMRCKTDVMPSSSACQE